MNRSEELWAKDGNGAFLDKRREDFARCRARGLNLRNCSKDLGISYNSCRIWDEHPVMKEHIAELRENHDSFIPVSMGYIIHELQENAKLARAAGQYKASNEAIMHMYEMLTTHEELIAQTPMLPSGDESKPASERLLELLRKQAEPVEQLGKVIEIHAERGVLDVRAEGNETDPD